MTSTTWLSAKPGTNGSGNDQHRQPTAPVGPYGWGPTRKPRPGPGEPRFGWLLFVALLYAIVAAATQVWQVEAAQILRAAGGRDTHESHLHALGQAR